VFPTGLLPGKRAGSDEKKAHSLERSRPNGWGVFRGRRWRNDFFPWTKLEQFPLGIARPKKLAPVCKKERLVSRAAWPPPGAPPSTMRALIAAEPNPMRIYEVRGGYVERAEFSDRKSLVFLFSPCACFFSFFFFFFFSLSFFLVATLRLCVNGRGDFRSLGGCGHFTQHFFVLFLLFFPRTHDRND